ncbi:MAG: MgtC/SapB family protein [Bryobacteraceae bacterium]
MIGWDRAREEHTAGIRSFPIVGMASCGFFWIVAGSPDSATPLAPHTRLITGIGFVEGGAILNSASTSEAPLPPPASGTPVSSASPSQWKAMTSLSF